MANTSDKLPLTTREKHDDRLSGFRLNADKEVQAALAPGKQILRSNFTTPALSALVTKEEVNLKIEKGATLSSSLSDALYSKPFMSLSANEKYFVLSLVTILSQNGTNTESVSLGDEFHFYFLNGTYKVERASARVQTGDLVLSKAASAIAKSETQRRAISEEVIKTSSIYAS